MNADQDPIMSQERIYKLLKENYDYALKALESTDQRVRERYLDYLVGSLKTIVILSEPYTIPEEQEPLYRVREKPFKEHGRIWRFFFGS